MAESMDEDDCQVIEIKNGKRPNADPVLSDSKFKKPRSADFDGVLATFAPNQRVPQIICLPSVLFTNFGSMLTTSIESYVQKQMVGFKAKYNSMTEKLQQNDSALNNVDDALSRMELLFHEKLTMKTYAIKPNGLLTNSQNKFSPFPNHTDEIQLLDLKRSLPKVNVPPAGPIKTKELTINTKVYAMKTDLFGIWVRAVITDINNIEGSSDKLYRVRFDSSKACYKNCTGKEIAYETPCDVAIPFGKRIIALFKPEEANIRPTMYAGMIAEPTKAINGSRYLIFFDDGFAQYVYHDDVRLVHVQSKNVWEDIHKDNQDFIKGYCEQYPERPMLRLQRNQIIKTEYNSSWWLAKVLDVDSSMVKMYFESEKRHEWIYRGSTRLGPLFNELEKAKHNRAIGKIGPRHNITTGRSNENRPYVEYTRSIADDVADSSNEGKKVEPIRRNTARKSTCALPKTYDHPFDEDDKVTALMLQNYAGNVETFREVNHAIKGFKKHVCGSSCREKADPTSWRGQNPLRLPMIMGWERLLRKYRCWRHQIYVQYRAPCGKLFRNLDEVNTYLLKVRSNLTIDFFSFDSFVNPYKAFVIKREKVLWSSADITGGKEDIKIECINCLSTETPAPLEYSKTRFPGKGVTLNLDESFLCGCDCKDECQDPMKCKCRQLTIKTFCEDGNIVNAGYRHRRLPEAIVTGIYECNSTCSCSKLCANRVVQNGIQIRLQMFKTKRKGWGIRTLDDVEAGTFLCIYAGRLITDQGADEDGHAYGDEYLAELDHIEVAEKQKEGYESEVDIDIDDVMEVDSHNGVKSESSTKDDEISDNDSDVESMKSSSTISSGNSTAHESDPEYEVPIAAPASGSIYLTRSSRKTARKAMQVPSPLLNDDSGTLTASENGEEVIEEKMPESAKLADGENKPRLGGLNTKKSQNSMKVAFPKQSETGGGETKPRYLTTRKYFGEDQCYIMDAKKKGNIGRYLNHSCNPNSFVQSVFVDSHDLRFPTVAFFSATRILAGSELTWDYSYEIGSVAGKVMYCCCESKNCKGRML